MELQSSAWLTSISRSPDCGLQPSCTPSTQLQYQRPVAIQWNVGRQPIGHRDEPIVAKLQQLARLPTVDVSSI